MSLGKENPLLIRTLSMVPSVSVYTRFDNFIISFSLKPCNISFKHPLPVSVTQPNSLITWGWGFSFFITSSSDRRSFLSEAGAFAKKKNPKKFLGFYHYFIAVIVLLRWACFSVLCPLGLFCFVCIETIQLNEMPFKYSVLTYIWTQPYPNLQLLVIVHWITLHLWAFLPLLSSCPGFHACRLLSPWQLVKKLLYQWL